MRRQVASPARVAVVLCFVLSCLGLLLYLWLSFGGPVPLAPQGYRVRVAFPEATQLARQADVRVSGVDVGRVVDLRPTRTGRTMATLELRPRFAPLRSGARAILRTKTILGETYVELALGPRGAPAIPDGGELDPGHVARTVQLDEVLRALPAARRRDLRAWIQGLAAGVQGRGGDLNAALGTLAPAEEDATGILDVVRSQSGAVRRLVRDTGVVLGALDQRRDQLRGLVSDSERVTRVTARRARALEAAVRALPPFLSESRRTLARVSSFAHQANPLVTQLHPAARALSPTLEDLDALAPDLRALFRALGPAIDASRKGLPAFDAFLSEVEPALGAAAPFLAQLRPALAYLGRYRREIAAFFGNVAAATQASVRIPGVAQPVHYLRTQNPLDAESLAAYGSRLPVSRSNPYPHPGAFATLPGEVYDAAQCGGGALPTLGEEAKRELGPQLTALVQKYVLAGGRAIAPPCRIQAPLGGTAFPHVRQDP